MQITFQFSIIHFVNFISIGSVENRKKKFEMHHKPTKVKITSVGFV